MTSVTTPATFRAVAHVTVAWAVLFALVHLYWAAGGAIGMNGNPADTPAAQAYIAITAYFLLGGVLFTALGKAER
jgi:hypothetical protein